MEKQDESATEYYAFLINDDGELDDVEEYIDYKERIIEFAAGAVNIGELGDDQYHLFMWRCQHELDMGMFEHSVIFIDKQDIPARKERQLNLLLARRKELTIDRQRVLDIVSSLAADVKETSGQGESGTVDATTTPQPEGKPQEERPKKKRKRITDFQLEEAARMVADGGVTRQTAEKTWKLPQGALSKKGAALVEEYRKKARQNRTVSKDEGDDLMYNEFR